MQDLLKGPRLAVVAAVLLIVPPVLLIAYHLAPQDVSPEEAKGMLYVYTADR